jgi:hypothetical protein
MSPAATLPIDIICLKFIVHSLGKRLKGPTTLPGPITELWWDW